MRSFKINHCTTLALLFHLGTSVTLAAPSLLVVDNPAAVQANSAHFSADAFFANDHVPLKDFTADPWPANYDTRPGDNLSLVSARIRMGASIRGFTLDYVRRSEALLIASADTAHAHYFAQTDQLFSAPRSLAIDYRLRGFEADGVRLGTQGSGALPLLGGKTHWGVAFNYLRGLRLRAETATAHFSTDGSTASLHGTREVWYSRLKPSSSTSLNAFHPFLEEPVPQHGDGYAFDLGIIHQLDQGTRFSAAINDLGGRIRWRNMPHMTQDFAINNLSLTSYSSNGTPAVSGYQDYRDYEMRLAPKVSVAVDSPITPRWSAYAKVDRTEGQTFPTVGAQWKVGDKRQLTVDYDTRWRTVGIGALWPFVSVGLRSDRLQANRSRALGIQLDVRYPF